MVVYFIRRIFQLVSKGGYGALISTNSLRDGDNRRGGLEYLIRNSGEIAMARRNLTWPGGANLVVSLVSIRKGQLSASPILDGKVVSGINDFLEESCATEIEAQCILENKALVFQGVIILGDGFLLSPAEGAALLKDKRNLDVVLPCLNGDELNNGPDQAPQRSIINFRNWSESVARSYPDPFAIVEEKVKPFRLTQNRERNRKFWWIYAEHRPGLTLAVSRLDRCFVSTKTTKFLCFSLVPTTTVFTQSLNVIASNRWELFAVLQSSLHDAWARKYSRSHVTRLAYAPTDCFENFALPRSLLRIPHPGLAALGEQYHEHRQVLMLRLWLGLTDVYNLFHSSALEAELHKHFSDRSRRDPEGLRIPEEHRAAALAYPFETALRDLEKLRRLHVELDLAVRDAYGWEDLELGHAFHEVETLPENDRTRYTLSPEARKELLRRLLQENHARAAEEAAATALPAAAKAARKPRTTKTPKVTVSPGELDLF